MKIEAELNPKKIVKYLFVAIVFFGIGGILLQPVIPQQKCLSSIDLNRDDLRAVIVLSRDCEGMGLRSSVIWKQLDGNVYAEPICVQGGI